MQWYFMSACLGSLCCLLGVDGGGWGACVCVCVHAACTGIGSGGGLEEEVYLMYVTCYSFSRSAGLT